MLNYTAIDFETANSYRGSPCSVGLVKVRDGLVIDERHWLMRPPAAVGHFDKFNVWVHGITADAVVDAPPWSDVLPELLTFIGDDIVVAHNAAFDIGVIRYACAVDGLPWPEMRFLCTLTMARRALQLPSYRLPFVAEALGTPMTGHHDALADARAVTTLVSGLAAMSSASTLEELAHWHGFHVGRMIAGSCSGAIATRPSNSGIEINPDADPEGYLFGRTIVFTGKLWAMVRQDAWAACASVGAVPEENTTQRTNVLVIGDLNPASLRPGEELSSKARKAFALQSKGQEIEVMTEDDFLRCLDEAPLG